MIMPFGQSWVFSLDLMGIFRGKELRCCHQEAEQPGVWCQWQYAGPSEGENNRVSENNAEPNYKVLSRVKGSVSLGI